MPRHKKDAVTKMLEATYRKDRDGTSDQSTMTEIITALPPAPSIIKTDYARAAWKAQLDPLVATQRIGIEDMVTLVEAFKSLDMAQRFQDKIDAMDDNDTRLGTFASHVKLFRQQWFEIMRNFAITPYDRMNMRNVLSGKVNKEITLAEKMTSE